METNSEMRNQWVDERLGALRPASQWQPDLAQGLVRFRTRRQAAQKQAARWRLTAATAIAAGLFLAAFPAPRAAAQRFCTACLMAAQNLAAPASHAAVKPEKEREPARDFSLTDAEGKPVSLSGLKGKVVLLNFWATWCGGCQTEIPWLIEFQRDYRDRGLTVLGVSMDDDGWKVVRPYMERKGINYRITIGNEAVASLYSVQAMPVTVMIDREGRVAAKHTGLIAKSDYKAEIETLTGREAPSH